MSAKVADKKALERKKNDIRYKLSKLDEEKIAIINKNKALDVVIQKQQDIADCSWEQI